MARSYLDAMMHKNGIGFGRSKKEFKSLVDAGESAL
jgi:hypothetical protein